MTNACFSGFGGEAQRRSQECGESQSDVMPVSTSIAFFLLPLHHKALNSSGIAHLFLPCFVPDIDVTAVIHSHLCFNKKKPSE